MIRKLHFAFFALLITLPLAGYARIADRPDTASPSRFGVFYEPLVAFSKPGSNQSRILEDAIESYRDEGNPAAIAPLESYLARSPNSPWQTSLLLNMALAREQAGYYSEAIDLLGRAHAAGQAADRPRERVVADRALGELLEIHTKFGNREKVSGLLQDADLSAASAAITEQVTQARSGLWEMENIPEAVLRCGIVALDALLAKHDGRDLFVPTLGDIDAGANGTSLARLQLIANTQGVSTKAVQRNPGDPVPVPSVMHLQVGHFATVLSKKKRQYRIFDPAFDKLRWITRDALEAESSGYFLVADKPGSWQTISADTASQVNGSGNTSSSQPDQLTTDDVTECDDPCSKSKGMPSYRVHSMLVSLNIIDTPLSYSPPIGPEVAVSLSYVQRAAYQPSTYTFSNLGPKWTFNWLSYVQDDPQNAGAQVRAYLPGGGSRDYSGYNASTGAFASEQRTAAHLVRTSSSPVIYERRMPDGRVFVYGQSDKSTYYPRRIFLTEVVDAHGNSVTLHYDAQQRLVRITDAIGRDSQIQYQEPNDPLLITGVEDPFGRSTVFTYDDSGLLASITDAVGMTSSFSYSGTLIEKMITPYGETSFNSGQSGTRRWLVITDPKGQQQRVEYRHSASGIPFSEASVPAGINVFNRYINSRNTFYWDKEAMARAPGDYTQAKIRHWYHKRNNTSISTGVQESIKSPLESRIWFNYPGQGWAGAEGTLDKPSRIGRVLPDGTTQLIKKSYNDFGNLIRKIDATGRELVYEYADNQIDLLRIERKSDDGYTALATYTYNSQHQPLTFTDANSNQTRYTYNPAGQLTSVTNALNQTTSLTYDSKGYLQSIVDPNSIQVAQYSYDTVGRVHSFTDASDYTLTYQYDGLDRLTKVAYPDGTSETVEWDRLDRSAYKDRYGQITKYTYDTVRNLVKVVNSAGHKNQFDYFANGLGSTEIDGKGNSTDFKRDIQGRLIQTLRPDQQSTGRNYDSSGRLLTQTDAMGGVTRYGYAQDNRLQTVTAPNQAKTSYRYDPHTGELAERQSPDSGTTTYTYDDAGNLTSKTSGNDQREVYAYDAMNRVLRIDYSDGQTVEYGYDTAVNGVGRVASIKDSSGTTYYRYNRRGQATNRRRVSDDGIELSVAYRYTPSGQISRITYPSGATVEYHYNRDRVESIIVNGQTLLGATEYASFGPVSSWLWGNGLSMTRSFDHNGRIQSYSLAGESRDIGYDPLGNVVSIASDNVQQHFEYDPDNRLTVAVSDEFSLGYDYDASGNRTWDIADGIERDYLYRPGSNTLSSADGVAYSYDSRGNTVDDGRHTYQYDGRNRMVSVDDGDTAEYGYNAMGARTYKQADNSYRLSADLNQDGRQSVADLLTLSDYIYHRESPVKADFNQDEKVNYRDLTCLAFHLTHNRFLERYFHCRFGEKIKVTSKTRFVYNGAMLLGEYDEDGNARQEVVWLGDRPVGVIENGKLSYISTDQIDAPVAISNQSGEVIWQWESAPFGESDVNSDPDGDGQNFTFNLRFPGQYYDEESGTHYNYYRDYDPSLGRYLQSDPIGLAGGINTYTYVLNNPLIAKDPLGLWSVKVSGFFGRGGTFTFGHSNGKWFATAGVGFGFGGGFTYNPNGKLPEPKNGNKYCGAEGYLGAQGWAGGTFGPLSGGWSGQTGGIIGEDSEGNLSFDFTEDSGAYGSIGTSSGLGVGFGGTLGGGIAW